MLIYDYRANNHIFTENDELDDPMPEDIAIRFAIYFSLTDPTFNDKDLELLMKEGEIFVRLIFLCNKDKILQQLKNGFAKKKGGNNVVPFKKTKLRR